MKLTEQRTSASSYLRVSCLNNLIPMRLINEGSIPSAVLTAPLVRGEAHWWAGCCFLVQPLHLLVRIRVLFNFTIFVAAWDFSVSGVSIGTAFCVTDE